MLLLTVAASVQFLWSLLLPAVGARECGNETGHSYKDIIVWSQEDADIKLDGCTKLLSPLVIGYNFTGDFVLRGVQNLTQGLRTSVFGWDDLSWSGNREDYEKSVQGLTSVTAPDLIEAGSNRFASSILINTTALKLVSFEKLQKASVIKLDFQRGGGSMNFPALESVISDLQILGNFTSMNFGSLTNAGSITIGLLQDIYMAYYGFTKSTALGSNPPMGIDFPSLVNCSLLSIAGNISRIFMPKLEAVANYPQSSGWTDAPNPLMITTNGLPFSLSLPSLWNVSDIYLAGTFANFSLPAVKDVKILSYSSEFPKTINLSPLESADRIYLRGNFSSYNITSLNTIDTYLELTSTRKLDCGPAKKAWLRMHPRYASGYYSAGFSCYEKPKKPFPGVQVGIGLGIGVPVILLIAILYWQGKRDRKRMEAAVKDRLPDYETEMEIRRTGGGELLPPYIPSEDPRSTDAASPGSSLSNMARPTAIPTERPPGYESSHNQEGDHPAQGSTEQESSRVT